MVFRVVNLLNCSIYYNSPQFAKVLQFVQKNGNICRKKEKQITAGLRLLLTFENAKSINKCLGFMEMMG